MSRSVVQRLWDQYQSEDSVRRPVSRPTTSYNTCRRPFSSSFGTTKEKKHYCAAARCRPLFKHQEEESPLLRCEIVFTMQVCMQEDQLCVPLNGRQRRNRLCWAGENMFLGRSNNGLLCCSQTSPDLQWRVIQGVY
ncbi:uncharacterized protein TNCV_1719911 [Trichonephila clavipes]|nr:uncharacterized protein TNCV_1719911 [Trichonephila clavipes]